MHKTLFVYICVVKFPTLSQISTVLQPQHINERMGEVKDLAAPKCCQSLYRHYITSSTASDVVSLKCMLQKIVTLSFSLIMCIASFLKLIHCCILRLTGISVSSMLYAYKRRYTQIKAKKCVELFFNFSILRILISA